MYLEKLTRLTPNSETAIKSLDILFQLKKHLSEGYFFDLSLLKELDEEYLEIALGAINEALLNQSYRPSVKVLFQKENDPFLNQASFAAYLTGKGLQFSPAKVATYYKRGVLPEADLMLEGKAYWYQSTIEKYYQEKFMELNYDLS